MLCETRLRSRRIFDAAPAPNRLLPLSKWELAGRRKCATLCAEEREGLRGGVTGHGICSPEIMQSASAQPAFQRRVLLVGDADGHLRQTIAEADPSAEVVSVETNFDALAEAAGSDAAYHAVLASLSGFDLRPEAAMAALREATLEGPNGEATRLILVGDRSADIATGSEAILRPDADVAAVRAVLTQDETSLAFEVPQLTADDLLLALGGRPGDGAAGVLRRLNRQLPRGFELSLHDTPKDAALQIAIADTGQHLCLHGDLPPAALRQLHGKLQPIAAQLAKVVSLDERHRRLQSLALTDDLTGCANKRYFRHFLDRILTKARQERFPVTLLLFDIDNFKSYNDRHGHAVGDAILKETAQLIKRCVRDHDFVARIGGDEFAVVFWEKDDADAPAEDGNDGRRGGQFPKGPLQIAARFRRLVSSPDFANLGESGTGLLTISGGMSVFPYDGGDADLLIEAADRALLFGSKQTGKNSIALVGDVI